MAKLAIKGHTTRGKEVIEILEMLGGKNVNHCTGSFINRIYFNEYYGCIESLDSTHHLDYIQLTLEEFLEKFTYKVGDKVQHKGATSCGTVYEIKGMRWKENTVKYTCCLDGFEENICWDAIAEQLQPFEEETMEQKLEQITLDIPDGYEFFGINDDNKVVLTKTQPQYPKTYVECAKILNCFGAAHIDGYKGELLDKFQELLICRNAYWKIAGEEMGLGKPWEPDWKDTSQSKHSIWFNNEGICIKSNRISYAVQHVLTFPTAAMRDAFYENFKELIESCKELL